MSAVAHVVNSPASCHGYPFVLGLTDNAAHQGALTRIKTPLAVNFVNFLKEMRSNWSRLRADAQSLSDVSEGSALEILVALEIEIVWIRSTRSIALMRSSHNQREDFI